MKTEGHETNNGKREGERSRTGERLRTSRLPKERREEEFAAGGYRQEKELATCGYQQAREHKILHYPLRKLEVETLNPGLK